MTKLYDRPEVSQTYFFPLPGGPLPHRPHAGPLDLNLPDSTRIGCYWCRPLEHAPTILYLHGNGECIAHQLDHWPQWARDAGANIFFVDYPGYASSDGLPSLSSCSQAARAALDYLLHQPESEVPSVVVMGRSVGSIFALDAAASSSSARVRGLALESGIADIEPRLALRVPYDRVGIDPAAIGRELKRDFNHQQKMESLSCPVLVLHTLHDGLVPPENSRLLAGWAGDRLHKLCLFEQGDHNSIQFYNAREYQAELGRFIQRVQE